VKAEVVSIGTEILLGDITDTNSNYIATRLPALGIDLYYMHQVGDNRARLAGVLRQAWERSDVVFCTGGLGPTEDDVTREAVCELIGEQPHVDPEQERILRQFFEGRGYPMPERNLKQAWLTPSTVAIPNPRGTAPGWWVEKDGRLLIVMPGPPSEMARMWEKEVEQRLRGRSTDSVIVSRTIKTAGIGEGSVDEMIGSLLHSDNPTIGVYAKLDGIHVRVTAKSRSTAEAQALIDPVVAELQQILGTAIWGYDAEEMQDAVGAMLKEAGLTVAAMESCTGGLLASTLTDTPGSSAYVRGGIVSYATAIKEQFGVSAETIARDGVISAATALAMAEAVRHALGSDIGVGITGVAGPDLQEGKPVGTVFIAVAGPGDAPPTQTGYTFGGSRESIKRRAVTTALTLLRRALLARTAAGRAG
jgi:nicotinamide-nucleotide amidase